MEFFLYFLVLIIITFVSAGPLVINDDDDTDVIDLSYYGNRLYGFPDDQIGDLVDKMNGSNVNPEELGSYLEGDILMPQGALRNGMIAKHLRWPGGIIPYEISSSHSAQAKSLFVHECMEEFHKKTCIRFVPRKASDKNYVFIDNGHSGCWSNIGMVGGRQVVNLQQGGCTTVSGTCKHELIHALGSLHEHTRPDRDEYVRINYQNIMSGMETNFEKAQASQVSTFGQQYDYGSVMHYNPTSFSKNQKETITALKKTSAKIGQREKLSNLDIAKLNTMYNCPGHSSDVTGSINDFVSGIFGLVEPENNNIEAIEEINAV